MKLKKETKKLLFGGKNTVSRYGAPREIKYERKQTNVKTIDIIQLYATEDHQITDQKKDDNENLVQKADQIEM